MKFAFLAATLFLFLTACGNGEEPAAKDPEKAQDPLTDPKAHNGPNGGHVVALGSEGFMEVKVNHGAGTVMVWFYKDRKMDKTVPPDEEPVFNFVHKTEGPQQMVGEDYDDSWLFWDDELLTEEFKSARFRVKLNGKNFAPPFVHSHKKPATAPTPDTESEGE
ncbi:MAG: hypothetical protein ACYTG3_19425 [Planctomycetota bacterium]|jgi:hypothetical protein